MKRRSFCQSALSLVLASPSPATVLDPWPPADLVTADDLARELRGSSSLPIILYAGFPILYRGAHISSAILGGPASKPEGLAALRRVAEPLPRTKQTVIYCGCCPFDRCPNIRPAYSELAGMKFEHVRVLYLPTNLHTDWTAKGYEVSKG